MKPIIGLLAGVDDERTTSVPHAYVSAIQNAGGVPVLIPYTSNEDVINALVSMCDGFCFTGGVDIDPCHYGENIQPECGSIQSYRDKLELSLFPKIFNTGVPIMGICRGAQLINVALGGTLYQDIPSEIDTAISHNQSAPRTEYSHDVAIRPGTPLYELLGEERIRANTFHHQAIKALGRGLEVMARADDGIIEAVYLPGERYLQAYQWHPERLCDRDDYQKAILREFITACENRANENKQRK